MGKMPMGEATEHDGEPASHEMAESASTEKAEAKAERRGRPKAMHPRESEDRNKQRGRY